MHKGFKEQTPTGIVLKIYCNIVLVLDVFEIAIQLPTAKLNLSVFDTAGQEDFQAIRRSNMSGSNIIMICYSCRSTNSLESIGKRWLPEILDENTKLPSPFIVVGTKTDLYDKEEVDCVSEEMAVKYCKTIGSKDPMRCCAKEWGETEGVKGNVDKVFNTAIRRGLIGLKILKKSSVLDLCVLL